MKLTDFKYFNRAALLTILGICSACESFVEIDPPKTQLVKQTVYQDDASATSAITGIYVGLMDTNGFASGGSSSISVLSGLSSDEFLNYAGIEKESFLQNNLLPINSEVKGSLWELGYKYIYYANSVLEGISEAPNITESTRKQLEGEATFIRAFCYFYLTNLFGDLPLILSTDYEKNSKAGRIPQAQVYEQIIIDLKHAEDFLAEDYHYSKGNRVRPNKWAAAALLARVYLYNKDWVNSEIEASSVINNTSLYQLESDLNNVFLANSTESIWQLMPIYSGYNTYEGATFIFSEYPTFVSLSSSVINSFEVGDLRKTNWIGISIYDGTTYYYPYKYKVQYNDEITEYSSVLRLGEQFLIRSESRAQQGKLGESISDLDAVRQRAGLPLIQDTNPSIDKDNLLLSIEHERQVELFSEWGHRWFDLKRTNRANSILAAIKTDWQSTDMLYPIPQSEIENDANLKPQNQGY